MTTGRTGDTLRPAERGNGVGADLFIAEVLDCFLQSGWLIHD